MRIAVWENLPPGGAKRAAFELGRALSQEHDVDLYRLSITSRRAFDLQPIARHTYEYAYEPLGGRLNRRLAAGRLAPRLLTIFGPLQRLHRRVASDMQGRGYDVVLAHTDGMTQSPYLLRWLPPLPSVYFCQEILRVAHERWLRQRWQEQQRQGPLRVLTSLEDRLALRRLITADQRTVVAAGTILVNSRYMRERVFSVYGRQASVCYLGIDPERFRPDASQPRTRQVLSIGSPLWIKGHDLVIDALAVIPAAKRPALRIIAQSDRGAENLYRRAGAAGVRLTVEAALDDAALVDGYRHAAMTVCAAPLEPFGLTAIESLACGTPVVAIDEGGYRETVVNGQTGLLAEPEAAALGAAIVELLEHPERAAAMGEAGRAHTVACWTWARSADRLESIIRDVVA